MGLDDEFVLDAAANAANTLRFHPGHMNHSRRRANVVRFWRRGEGCVSMFVARDVGVGEELLFDYGRRYWRGRERLELP